MHLFPWLVTSVITLVACVVAPGVTAEVVGPNLLPNASLEEVVDGKTPGIEFTFQEGQPTIKVDSTVARTGNNSVMITCTDKDRGAIGKRIPLEGGKTYRFSAWYKTSAGVKPKDITLRLMFFKSATGWTDADKVPLTPEMLVNPLEGAFRFGLNNHVDGQVDASQDWQELRMTVKVPENVVSVHFQVYNWKSGGTLWVDDLAAEQIELSAEDLAAAQEAVKAAAAAAEAARNKAREESEVAQALPRLANHPRLLATEADFARLKQYIATDATAARWALIVKGKAEAILAQPVSTYEIPDGLRLLNTSRRVLDRVQSLVLTYRFTGEQRYLDRAWRELEAAAGFPDWNPRHFLDTAEMTAAFALAYDWAYDSWTPAQKEVLRRAIVEMGLQPGLRFYEGHPTGTNFVTAEHNWNFVCNGGLALGALAVIDTDRTIALDVLIAGLKSVPKALVHFAPDGGWAEGLSYWHYSIRYLIPYIAAFQTALGTDFGLSQAAGLAQTGLFPIYMTGPTKKVFNYADGGSGTVRAAELYWLAQAYNRPGYAWWQNQIAGANISPLDLLWYRPGLIPPEADDLPLDGYFRNVEVASMRSSWSDPKALFLAFKAGDNTVNHGNLDLGTFVLEAQGRRWAEELGADDYNLPGYFSGNNRWNFYRCRAEGQNTLVINPGRTPDQNPTAKATISFLKSTPGAAIAVADLTTGYSNSGATKVERGVALLDNRSYALVQDEVTLRQPGEVWWFMHTSSLIELQDAGRSAVLAQGEQRLLARLLAPAGAQFVVMPAKPLPTSPTVAGQNTNAGIQKLAVHLTDVTETGIAVQFLPLTGAADNARPVVPQVLPLAEWSSAYTAPDGEN